MARSKEPVTSVSQKPDARAVGLAASGTTIHRQEKGKDARRPRSVERPRSPSPRREPPPGPKEISKPEWVLLESRTSRPVSNRKRVGARNGPIL